MWGINGSEWVAVLAGVAAITWVNWYFFVAGRTLTTQASSGTGASQEQTIIVNGGYTPSAIRVKAGRPVRLIFDRRDTGACSDEVVFPDFGIRRFLPTGKKTVIEIKPANAGRYEFTCGMSMHRGAIVAED